MKNRQGIIWAPVLIIVGAVVVAGVAGYMLFYASSSNNETVNAVVVNQENNNVNTNSVLNVNQATNTNVSVNTNTTSNTNIITDPTASWKTYTNTTYNISFKYPNDWRVAEGETSTPYKIDVFPNTSSGWSTLGAITFWVGNSYSLRCGESPKTTTTETTIGGFPTTLYTVVDQKTPDCKFRSYLLSRTPTGWTKPANGAYNEIQVMATKAGSYVIQDAILTSLKLSDPTAGWKAYTDATYGFSIKYPQDLTLVKPCGTTGTLVTFCVGFRDAEGKDITVFVHPSTDIVGEGWFSGVEITSDKNETIHGISWRRIATKGGQPANQADRLGQSGITIKNKQSFSVAMSYYADFDEMIANYNAMLPTFTFTN